LCLVGFVLSKMKLLDAVSAEVQVCEKCPLSKTRKKAVPGVGSPRGRIMFVGEAPGRSEDLKGEPFVGAAGKFLDVLLSEIGLSREAVFITNVAKCRPPHNRQPYPAEVQACTPYLDRQIRSIRPRVIVTLGNHSTAYMLAKAGLPFDGITLTHGKFLKVTLLGLSFTVFSTFHPAAALYNGQYKKQLIEDFQTLGHEFARRRLVEL